jgi:hypothetical protein
MLALLCIFLAAVAAVLLIVAWAGRGTVAGEDPLCGNCRYCVRGLEGTICPECGGDLREVGVLTPGSAAPMGRGKRLLIWTLATPLLALLLFGMLSPLLIPQWIKTTQRRVIFSQSDYCFVTITAEANGKKLIFGYPNANTPPATPEVLLLSHNNSHMDVQLPARTYTFTDHTGKRVSGKFDAKAIETWLNDGGFTDARVADRAADIAAAVDEMGTPAGKGFTHFAPDHNGTPLGVAHPTFTVNFPQPNELTTLSGVGLFVLLWLAGLPLILRQRSGTRRPGRATPARDSPLIHPA